MGLVAGDNLGVATHPREYDGRLVGFGDGRHHCFRGGVKRRLRRIGVNTGLHGTPAEVVQGVARPVRI